ncbi:MAG: hypothetical protein SGJ05_03400 [bacterium]|nr:hypothetical protein [bacterium]
MTALSQEIQPARWWSAIPDARDYDYVHTSDVWGLVLCVQRVGCYAGSNIDSLAAMLSNAQFDHIEVGTRAALLRSGPLIVGGSELTGTTGGRVYVWDSPSSEPRVLRPSDLGGEQMNSGFGSLDLFGAFEPNAFQIRNNYSFDRGQTWTYAPPPDTIQRWTSTAYDARGLLRVYRDP